jgi:hypothetical protein
MYRINRTNHALIARINGKRAGSQFSSEGGSVAQEGWISKLIDKLSEYFYLIIFLVGVAVFILAATKGTTIKGVPLPITDRYSQIGVAVFGLLLTGAGIWIGIKGPKSVVPVPKKADYEIKILAPSRGAKVNVVDVTGTLKELPPTGYRLWVFRLYKDGRVYPIKPCSINEEAKTWAAEGCDIGGKQGETRWFTVNLVGADGEALIDYLKEAIDFFSDQRPRLESSPGKNDAPYLPSIKERTRDMVQCDAVKVERL